MWAIVYEENVCREDGYGASDMVGALVEKGSLWGLVGGAEHGVSERGHRDRRKSPCCGL